MHALNKTMKSAQENTFPSLGIDSASLQKMPSSQNIGQDSVHFSSLLSQAINTVNTQQAEASTLAHQVEMGDQGASLVKAMIASQKANVAFQATVQVRNKVVSAYQEIMNMPI
jgi:flagellar hook-basal body complex protein FliE